MFSKTISAVLLGMRSDMITVEADVSGGLPYFEMVGYLSAEQLFGMPVSNWNRDVSL